MKKSIYFLNTRQKKEVIDKLKEQFGFKGKINHTILKNQENELFLVSSSVGQVNLEDLRIKKIGLKFAKEIPTKQAKKQTTQLLLTPEGAQIIGPESSKNIVEIGKFQLKRWFAGKNIDFFCEKEDIYLIKVEKKNTTEESDSEKLEGSDYDFIGCAKYREKKLINNLPKARRQEVI